MNNFWKEYKKVVIVSGITIVVLPTILLLITRFLEPAKEPKLQNDLLLSICDNDGFEVTFPNNFTMSHSIAFCNDGKMDITDISVKTKIGVLTNGYLQLVSGDSLVTISNTLQATKAVRVFGDVSFSQKNATYIDTLYFFISGNYTGLDRTNKSISEIIFWSYKYNNWYLLPSNKKQEIIDKYSLSNIF
jgi:hypothetical protein